MIPTLGYKNFYFDHLLILIWLNVAAPVGIERIDPANQIQI